ncbi:hypothetical protein BDQ17DRAFT_1428448 [Cyathus striatus]|nr:hypothetical protein BDQ17DRAFT_1428448 [Cyathus striatus]
MSNSKTLSINPIEAKIRAGKWAGGQLPAGSILGFDCAGVLSSLGSQVTSNMFSTGENFGFWDPQCQRTQDAAAVLLGELTSWEMIDQTGAGSEPGALLVINGAGGVGSVGISLLGQKEAKNIIATASRDVSINHVKALVSVTNLTKSMLDQAIDVVAPMGTYRIGGTRSARELR